jgi:hypothetical protein
VEDDLERRVGQEPPDPVEVVHQKRVDQRRFVVRACLPQVDAIDVSVKRRRFGIGRDAGGAAEAFSECLERPTVRMSVRVIGRTGSRAVVRRWRTSPVGGR